VRQEQVAVATEIEDAVAVAPVMRGTKNKKKERKSEGMNEMTPLVRCQRNDRERERYNKKRGNTSHA
jgi:hypothetical protein